MIKNYILVRYGELVLKGLNKSDFIKREVKYINSFLLRRGFEFEIEKFREKIIIKPTNEEDIKKILLSLENAIGISNASIVIREEKIEDYFDNIKSIFDKSKAKTFKVEIKRREKTNFSTYDKKVEIATFILENFDIKVDVKNPDIVLDFELYSNYLLMVSETVVGVDGLPPGSSGRALVLLSGGIDSPVAAFKMMSRGLHVDFLSFEMPHQTGEESRKKIMKLANKLNSYQHYLGKMYFADISPFTKEVSHFYTDRYNIILMRRAYIKVASLLAKEKGYQAIITGDALGQVASQTIESQNVIREASVSPILIQPLMGMNKSEIIEVSKKIDTYDISIIRAEDTCLLFVPKSPVTKPSLRTVELLESTSDFIEDIIIGIKNNIIKVEV